MSDSKQDDLDKRINKAKKAAQSPSTKQEDSTFYGKSFRVGTDLVAGVFVGVIIGLMVDHFFGTSPWGLIGFFILGSLAGFLNMYRTLFHNSGFFVGLERSTKYDDPTENNQSEKPDEKK